MDSELFDMKFAKKKQARILNKKIVQDIIAINF